jgi:hypothetical protein
MVRLSALVYCAARLCGASPMCKLTNLDDLGVLHVAVGCLSIADGLGGSRADQAKDGSRPHIVFTSGLDKWLLLSSSFTTSHQGDTEGARAMDIYIVDGRISPFSVRQNPYGGFGMDLIQPCSLSRRPLSEHDPLSVDELSSCHGLFQPLKQVNDHPHMDRSLRPSVHLHRVSRPT